MLDLQYSCENRNTQVPAGHPSMGSPSIAKQTLTVGNAANVLKNRKARSDFSINSLFGDIIKVHKNSVSNTHDQASIPTIHESGQRHSMSPYPSDNHVETQYQEVGSLNFETRDNCTRPTVWKETELGCDNFSKEKVHTPIHDCDREQATSSARSSVVLARAESAQLYLAQRDEIDAQPEPFFSTTRTKHENSPLIYYDKRGNSFSPEINKSPYKHPSYGHPGNLGDSSLKLYMQQEIRTQHDTPAQSEQSCSRTQQQPNGKSISKTNTKPRETLSLQQYSQHPRTDSADRHSSSEKLGSIHTIGLSIPHCRKGKRAPISRPDRPCTHCGITKSCTWRPGPAGRSSLCNTCGYFYRRRNRLSTKRKDAFTVKVTST
eukprot:CFRG1059T1